MPNQAHSGVHGVPWVRCDICGRDFPSSDVQRQKGRIKCQACYDDITVETRDIVIREVLNGSPNEMDVAEILKNQTTGDNEPFNY